MTTTIGPFILNDLFLLYEQDEIYGNSHILVQKQGRLLIVHTEDTGVSCYVINTATDPPLTPYEVDNLKNGCLMNEQPICDAFGIPGTRLVDDPSVIFHPARNGSFQIRFKQDPIKLTNGGPFYNLLVKQLKEYNDTAVMFSDLLEARKKQPNVKVFIHDSSVKKIKDISMYDVVINIDKAGCLIQDVPHYWEIYYNSDLKGIEFNPLLSKCNKHNLRQIGR